MNAKRHDSNNRDIDDALLTAYALGQLDEAEEAAFKERLAGADHAAATVEQIRALAEHVRQAAEVVELPQPSDDLRRAVENRLSELHTPGSSRDDLPRPPADSRRRRRWPALAVAVSLLIVAIPVAILSTINARRGERLDLALELPELAVEGTTALDGDTDGDYDQNVNGAYGGSNSAYGNDAASIGPVVGTELSTTAPDAHKQKADGQVELRNATRGLDAEHYYSAAEVVRDSELKGQGLVPTDLSDVDAAEHNDMQRQSAPKSGMGGSMGGGVQVERIAGPGNLPTTTLSTQPSKLGDSSSPGGASYGTSVAPEPARQEAGSATGGMVQHGFRFSKSKAAGEKASDAPAVSVPPAPEPAPGKSGSVDESMVPRPDIAKAAERRLVNEDLMRRQEKLEQTKEQELEQEALTEQAKRSLDEARAEFSGKQSDAKSKLLPAYGGPAAKPDVGQKIMLHKSPEAQRVRIISREAGVSVDRRYMPITDHALGELEDVPPLNLRSDGLATEGLGTEQYDAIVENPFLPAAGNPLSTFSIDVDTASYSNVRRFLQSSRMPPPDAVRIEEMVNYFPYDYPEPEGDEPFSVSLEVAQCPWNGDNRLLRVGLLGRRIDTADRGPSNLVFLLDVSGSMRDENKLPLVKKAMGMLADQMTEDDRVSIVTYAGQAGVALEPTSGENREKIRKAIESLTAGGSTHGSAGIQLAYDQAAYEFVGGGTNRVILATDGDLNVGITEDDDLVGLIRQQATSGVFLTVLGFGTGNLKDAKMEKLADHGNGTYAYIDSVREAHKVLVEQMTGSLMTIAKDVKIQIEFNPTEVASYRLIGYENRMLTALDFADDKKDAGEIGAGHTVTALYELTPAGENSPSGGIATAGLKYQRPAEQELTEAASSGELLTLKLCYKEPEGEESKLLEFVARDEGKRFGEASADFRFASAVASFGMVLRHSEHVGDVTLQAVEEFAADAVDHDPEGYRAEFVDLIHRAEQLQP